jgi:prepilin-type N-terminal cleavage/methylation domain-containing protein
VSRRIERCRRAGILRANTGFTLVELAMVLFIVALLLGGLLVPLATQLEGRQRAEAQIELQEIREALIGYAIANDGNLPCYADDTGGIDVTRDEDSPAACNPGAQAGDQYLPWSTLGLDNGTDPWNQYWRYRVDEGFANDFPDTATPTVTITTLPVVEISIRELDGSDPATGPGTPQYNYLISSEYPVAIVYSMGANQTADYENADYETFSWDDVAETGALYEAGPVSNLDRDNDGEDDTDKFDDLVIWLSRPQLFYKLVSAEVLP